LSLIWEWLSSGGLGELDGEFGKWLKLKF